MKALRIFSIGALGVAASCSIYDSELLSRTIQGAGSGGLGTAGNDGGIGGKGGTSAGSAGSAARAGSSGNGAGGRGGTLGNGGEAGGSGESGEGDAGELGTSGAAGETTGEGGAGGSSGRAGAGGAGGTGVNAGAAGKAGAGGTNAGSGGTNAGAGGSAGRAGGGSGGSAGAGETCSGCARLSVPLEVTSDRQHFQLQLPEVSDFSAGTITYRVLVVAGSGGEIRLYAQHGGVPDYNLTYGGLRQLSALSGWTTVTWDLGAASTTFDKTTIARIGIEITGANSTSFTNPSVLYLDSISVTGPSVGPYTFDSASTLSSAPTAAGANVLWLSPDPDEATVGATLSWLGP